MGNGILKKVADIASRSAIFALFLLVWQIYCTTVGREVSVIPAPIEVAKALWSLTSSGELISDALHSFKRVLVGFLVAVVLGMSMGVILGSFRKLSKHVTPLIDIFRPIPPVAWIPIAILWFGIGDKPAYFLIYLGAFFPIFTNTLDGVRSIEPPYVNAARCLGARRFLIIKEIFLPIALPSILTGLRVGLGFAWMVTITAELIAATSGLGYLIQINRMLLQAQNIVAGMVVIGVMGFSMNQIMLLIERLLVPWKRDRE